MGEARRKRQAAAVAVRPEIAAAARQLAACVADERPRIGPAIRHSWAELETLARGVPVPAENLAAA